MNLLSKEKSPYLLQHAENPVNWFPWGEEAFEKAKAEDKPVFLSIGYSTCHWCHVMAHESFEDDEVAEVLNRDYISIKVDREERPDVDTVYMQVCQALTGSGGWPLTVIMTPQQKPFWAGTYLPKTTVYGRLGLIELLDIIKQKWDTQRQTVLTASEQLTSLLETQDTAKGDQAQINKSLLHKAVAGFKNNYDDTWGGFGGAPKFPTPHNLLFLLRYSVFENYTPVRIIAEHTLTQMFRGGIFDHIGGGFSRYSTDEKWLVPHFEKMLYDNALLALAYLETYHITRDRFYANVAERTLDYVLRELTDAKGGFYCAQDADSDGVEGKYYVFTRQEIYKVLGEKQGQLLCDWFGVSDKGNFEGKSILNLLHNAEYEKNPPQFQALIDKLYAYRTSRTSLHKDDKVLTSWNTLMIAAMAKAGLLLLKPEYLEAAKNAQRFIQQNMTDSNGNLMLRWREGEASYDGQLDDYAFYAFSLLELYNATCDIAYLKQAIDISKRMLDYFWDNDAGGFFFYSKHGEQLISRPKEVYDGAIPSGNSVAGVVLEKLSKLTGDVKWQKLALEQLAFLATQAQRYPQAHSMALIALSGALYPSLELVCATSHNAVPEELTSYLIENALPNLTLILKTADNKDKLSKIAPFTSDYPVPENGTAYYLCKNGACSAPVYELDSLINSLNA
ncbi:MAG: thioredoxin domain-containing protein [Christensenellales bacterium]|jgi:uncharacterized protein YyaL (SSP411 family)